jgi:phosphorylcholine metabolism protein LicD
MNATVRGGKWVAIETRDNIPVNKPFVLSFKSDIDCTDPVAETKRESQFFSQFNQLVHFELFLQL